MPYPNPYLRGKEAHAEGKRLEDNPHPSLSDAGIMWSSGWHDADVEDRKPELRRRKTL